MSDLIRRVPQDRRIERKIITGMIISDDFLRDVEPLYRVEGLTLSYAKYVAEWCLEYYNNYKRAPGKDIQEIFLDKGKYLDEDDQNHIEKFLSSLSEEYQNNGANFNADFYLEGAEKHFRIQSLEKLKQKIDECIIGGRPEDGENLVANYNRVTRLSLDESSDVFRDRRLIQESLSEERRDLLFKFPGDLGQMFGYFARKEFWLVVGSTGRGKSWWLMYIALLAAFAGFKVLFASLEMSRVKMMRRIQSYLSGRPVLPKHAGQILLPVFDCIRNQTGECKESCRVKLVEAREDSLPGYFDAPRGYLPCVKCKGVSRDYQCSTWFRMVERELLTPEDGLKKSEALVNHRLKGGSLKVIDPPPGTMKASHLNTILDNYSYYENWDGSVLITDYADKCDAEDRSLKDYRHRLYETILVHKAIAMQRNMLVVSGSQSNTSRDEEKDIKSGGLAEDIRKKNEIDGGISLNQTAAEKRRGVMRAGQIKLRDDDSDAYTQAVVLQQLKIGRCDLGSFWPGAHYFKK